MKRIEKISHKKNIVNILSNILLVLLVSFLLTSCINKEGKESERIEQAPSVILETSISTIEESVSEDTSISKDEKSSKVSQDDFYKRYNENTPDNKISYEENYIEPLKTLPEYSGSPYTEVNNNEPFFTDDDKDAISSSLKLNGFDELGRNEGGFACLTPLTLAKGERNPIGNIKPSGWHTVKYPGVVEGNYLYNRCHLIGWQLYESETDESNLITGTRYFNVEGMLPFENKVADYIKDTGNSVIYRVTPIFKKDNLLASGVLMEAYSLEDEGEGIKFNVFIYNVQPGVEIDYATGDSWLQNDNQTETNDNQTATSDKEKTPSPQTTPEPTIEPKQSYECDYILNKNTKVFHYPDCDSVSQMKEKNKEYFTGTKEEAMNMGYTPCHNCFHY